MPSPTPALPGDVHLRLDHVTKRFGETAAVDDVSFDVPRGSFATLLGPSGCGKTTTLRMIAGFYDPDHGDIVLGGKRINELPAHRRGTAMVFQDYALFPHMTVHDNVAYGLRVAGVASQERERRVSETLEFVGLSKLGDRWPNQLSGGQQQRVAVARALAGKPAILLADEPTGNLDSRNGEAVMNLLKELHAGGATICMVTHDERFAQHADRTVHLFDGRVVEDSRIAA